MLTAVRVEAAVPGRKSAGTAEHPVELDLPAEPITLRRLIEAVVRAEVTAFQARAEQRSFVRVLTEKSLAEGVESGAVRSGGGEAATDVDADEAVAVALLAQEDGLYQVVIDDEPADDLDQFVDVRVDTRLLFLRLVPLAGG